jgi:hypothetical protein
MRAGSVLPLESWTISGLATLSVAGVLMWARVSASTNTIFIVPAPKVNPTTWAVSD